MEIILVNDGSTDKSADTAKKFGAKVIEIKQSVFENNDLLSKAIIKKIIPFISSRGIFIPEVILHSPNVYYGSSNFCNIPVTIKPLGEYFRTPLFLNNKEDVSDSIWEFLSTNITDLL